MEEINYKDKHSGRLSALDSYHSAAAVEESGGADKRGKSRPNMDKVSRAQIKLAYLQSLKRKIEENKEYPLAAKRLGQTGTVGVYFVILKDGSFREVQLKKRSAFAILNAAALDVLAKTNPFKAIPEELATGHLDINMNIEYILTYGGYHELN